MKKILLIGSLLVLGVQAQAAAFATNILSGGIWHLLTNRASIYSIEIVASSGTLAPTLYFYDNNSASTNISLTNLVTRTTYPTNYVYSTTNIYGYASWYTNTGVWTVTTTNSITNSLTPVGIFIAPANSYAQYDTDILCAKGVVVQTSTNAVVVLNYRTGM